MLGVALIFFREVLEAALVVGIMAAATCEVAGRSRWILAGLGAGLAGACLLAVFAERLAGAAAGMGQELFNAGVLLTAVAMLGWHTLWMARHGRELARTTGSIGADVAAGRRPLYAVAVVIGLAVLREGSEVVLFLSGLLASGTTDNRSLLLGAAAGISAGVLVGVGLARGLRIIPIRHLFSVTTILLALLAAGMAARAVAFLCQAGYCSEFTQTAWDTSAWAADGSALGQFLNALIGYTALPMVIQVLAYVVTLGLLAVAAALSRRPAPGAPTRLALAAGLLLLGGAATPSNVQAAFKVYSPYVEAGEWEFEFGGHRNVDDDPAQDDAHSLSYEVGYSPTARWHTAVGLKTEGEPDQGNVLTEFQWENIFQLTEAGQYWLDLGAYVEYAKGLEHGDDQALEWKVLLEKSVGPWVAVANPIFAKPFGEDAGGVEFEYAWGTYYRWMPLLEPGFEAYGGVGEITNAKPLAQQEHLLGPDVRGVFTFDNAGRLKYNLGYLFGLTEGTPDGVFKFELEYEVRF